MADTDDLYKLHGGVMCWVRLGDSTRRALTNAEYVAMGSPAVRDLLANDWFWGRNPMEVGEVYRKTGESAVWRLMGDANRKPVRRWMQAAEYTANGSPPVVELTAAHLFWGLPTTGAVPTA